MRNRKQGEENFEMAKKENVDKNNYIFQKNDKTKIGFTFIIAVLALLIGAVVVTNFFF